MRIDNISSLVLLTRVWALPMEKVILSMMQSMPFSREPRNQNSNQNDGKIHWRIDRRTGLILPKRKKDLTVII